MFMGTVIAFPLKSNACGGGLLALGGGGSLIWPSLQRPSQGKAAVGGRIGAIGADFRNIKYQVKTIDVNP
jgi:hypothetical protein